MTDPTSTIPATPTSLATGASSHQVVGDSAGAAVPPSQAIKFPLQSTSYLADASLDWIDSVIGRLQGIYKTPATINQLLTQDEVIALIFYCTKHIMADGTLTEVDVPLNTKIKVFGDIHGQYQDFHQLLDITGRVPEIKALFVGDYVDRGPQSVEVICYLMALKIRYPDRVYLLRGNHESPSVCRIYGFYASCTTTYGVGLWWDFQTLFNRLPMSALINKRVLCMHGGLSPELTNLDMVRATTRPVEAPDSGFLTDLLWSDPTNRGLAWYFSQRGISCAFGSGVVEAASKLLGFQLVIRAHQVVQDGYEIMVGSKSLITVFSAPNYCNQFSNAAAVVVLEHTAGAGLQVSFQQLKLPANPKLKIAPMCAGDPNEKKVAGYHPTWNLNDPEGTYCLVDANNNPYKDPTTPQ
uniref:Serine/threonine-protein phosphatase n=1 Tax=Rhabditophanes sp. KR3021 TaxID=114890 RepID=A0AC35UDD6_9BILA